MYIGGGGEAFSDLLLVCAQELLIPYKMLTVSSVYVVKQYNVLLFYLSQKWDTKFCAGHYDVCFVIFLPVPLN